MIPWECSSAGCASRPLRGEAVCLEHWAERRFDELWNDDSSPSNAPANPRPPQLPSEDDVDIEDFLMLDDYSPPF